jgi:gluconate kinase
MDLKEIGWVACAGLMSQYRDQLRAFVNAVMNLRFP